MSLPISSNSSSRSCDLLSAACALAVAACAATPYEQVRGTPYVISTSTDAALTATGYRLKLDARCQLQVVDRWCAPSDTPCRTPPSVRKEDVACPADLDVASKPIAIRAPWGALYRGASDAGGVAEVEIDWAKANIDPLAEGAAAQLMTGWFVYSDEGKTEAALAVSAADVETMLTAIGAATETEYTAGAVNERAALKATFVDGPPLVLGRTGAITIAIANAGPQPAYRVIAKLRSDVDGLHGVQLSFGRIAPGKTKTKTRAITLPAKVDETSPTVVADVSYFNGESLTATKRLTLIADQAPAARIGLAVECKVSTAEVGPGERVRIPCEIRNKSKDRVSDLKVAVAVADAVTPNLGPKSLAAGEVVALEFIGVTPATAKQGSEVPVSVQITAAGVPAFEQKLTVRIATFAAKCKTGKLTREEYRSKRKRLQAALASGALTQKEFDKYDADLVSCLE